MSTINCLANLVTEHKELVSTKEIISYRGAKSFVSIFLGERLRPTFLAIPYFSILSYYRGF